MCTCVVYISSHAKWKVISRRTKHGLKIVNQFLNQKNGKRLEVNKARRTDHYESKRGTRRMKIIKHGICLNFVRTICDEWLILRIIHWLPDFERAKSSHYSNSVYFHSPPFLLSKWHKALTKHSHRYQWCSLDDVLWGCKLLFSLRTFIGEVRWCWVVEACEFTGLSLQVDVHHVGLLLKPNITLYL